MDAVNMNASHDASFVPKVQEEIEPNPCLYYQCGDRAAGCPLNFVCDIPVSQIMPLASPARRRLAARTSRS